LGRGRGNAGDPQHPCQFCEGSGDLGALGALVAIHRTSDRLEEEKIPPPFPFIGDEEFEFIPLQIKLDSVQRTSAQGEGSFGECLNAQAIEIHKPKASVLAGCGDKPEKVHINPVGTGLVVVEEPSELDLDLAKKIKTEGALLSKEEKNREKDRGEESLTLHPLFTPLLLSSFPGGQREG
jgi:hypothetical protein